MFWDLAKRHAGENLDQPGAQDEVGFVSPKQSGAQTCRLILKDLRQTGFASFGFVLTHFSGLFTDSMGLSGFVLLNFRFFFFGVLEDHRGASSGATQSHFSLAG
jgi:hypothetical protein